MRFRPGASGMRDLRAVSVAVPRYIRYDLPGTGSLPSTEGGRRAMSDRTTEALLTALKLALAEPGEHRLYRGGKLAGLFASRNGPAGDAAALALRDGLFGICRSE